MKLTYHLKTYWTARRHALVKGNDGKALLDYAELIELIERGIADRAVDSVIKLVWDLDGINLPYYAPRLVRDETSMLQAFHDLARAILFCIASKFARDEFEQRQMLMSSVGAANAIDEALRRFSDFSIPSVIVAYAAMVRMKIEQQKSRATDHA